MYSKSQLHFQKLSQQDEDLLIARFPDYYFREYHSTKPEDIDLSLWGGDKHCYHLIELQSSGVKCVKCGAWYCA